MDTTSYTNKRALETQQAFSEALDALGARFSSQESRYAVHSSGCNKNFPFRQIVSLSIPSNIYDPSDLSLSFDSEEIIVGEGDESRVYCYAQLDQVIQDVGVYLEQVPASELSRVLDHRSPADVLTQSVEAKLGRSLEKSVPYQEYHVPTI